MLTYADVCSTRWSTRGQRVWRLRSMAAGMRARCGRCASMAAACSISISSVTLSRLSMTGTAYVSIRQRRWSIRRYAAYAPPLHLFRAALTLVDDRYCIRQHTSAYVSIRQHTSAYVSIRQHTSAYVSIRTPSRLSTPGTKGYEYAHVCSRMLTYPDVC
jgi:hypothetical protein